MILSLAGPIDGHISEALSVAKGSDWLCCAGDFGVWPDPALSPGDAGEFASRYIGATNDQIRTPILTISGVHDDNRWLDRRASHVGGAEILSNVHFLRQGFKTTIGTDVPCRVTGLGRAYSPSTYEGKYNSRSHRHYSRHDLERACSSGPTDLLVVYESLDAPGIRNLVFATRPKLILTNNLPNRPIYKDLQGIPVISLGRREQAQIEWTENHFIPKYFAKGHGISA